MKILKIQNLNLEIINKNFYNKRSFLTKTKLTSKIDMFCKNNKTEGNLLREKLKFISLRDNFNKLLKPLYINAELAAWNFYTDSTDENLKLMIKAENNLNKLYKNKVLYKKFKKLKTDNLDEHELRQLKNIIKNFEEELKYSEDLKILRNKENKTAQKYNSYIPKIEDKEVSRTEIRKKLQTEKDPEIRKKYYEADLKGADLIAEDLIELVKLRNNFAQKVGYKNFFEYKLKEDFEVDIDYLNKLLDEIYSGLKIQIKNSLNKKYKKLKKFFNIQILEPYHYGLLLEDNPDYLVNKELKNKEQIVDICKKTYSGMGFDIDKLLKNGNLVLDLFPRKGKNTHGFSFGVEPAKNARILANLTNNTMSIDTLNHELGHSVYTLGLSLKMPFIDQEEYPAVTEAVAMMMGDLQKKEDILKDIDSEETLDKFKKSITEDELKFISWSIQIINFERELYKNPEQDLKKIWHDMSVKYQFTDEKEKMNNKWASIPHFLSHPAYYQNYFRAAIIKAQFYNYLKSQLGNITENPKTAEFLRKNLFKYGISLEENELIEKFTGKKLSTENFINTIKEN